MKNKGLITERSRFLTGLGVIFSMIFLMLFTLSQPVFSYPDDAETPVKSGDWLYFDKGGCASVCAYLGKKEHITIPSEIDGKTVTELCFNGIVSDGYFSGQFSIDCFFLEYEDAIGNDYQQHDIRTTWITIPDTVKRIGQYTFYKCYSLRQVDMPQGLEVIEDAAFDGCHFLSEADIPLSVERIGNSAFRNTAIADLVFPEGLSYIGEQAFSGIPAAEVIIPDSVKYIGSKAFSVCTELQSVKLPKDLKKIPSDLFSACESLESIEIPETVREIGDGAFKGCALESVRLPSGLTNIPSYLFYGCSSLKSAHIPEGVQTVGGEAFANCISLEEVHFPKSLKSAVGVFYNDPSLKTVSFDFDKDTAEHIMGSELFKEYMAIDDNESDYSNVKIIFAEKDTDPDPVPTEKTAAERIRDFLTITAIVFSSLFLITICMFIIQSFALKPKKAAEQRVNALTKYSTDTVICKHCGTSSGKEASYCTNCGKKLPKNSKKEK